MQLLQLTGICLTLFTVFQEGSSQRRRYRRTRWKFQSTASGYIYASRSFRTRYKPNMNPNVCFNLYDKPPELNDTFRNGTRIYSPLRKTYQNFLCPLNDPTRPYCCGPATRQICCTYWADYGRSIGASFGIFFVALVALWVLQSLLKSLGTRFPKLKRCGSRVCPGRSNEVRQGPSTCAVALPSPSTPPPEGSPTVEPKPIAVAPLAPPSYSSLSIRQVDIFGDPITSTLPPPPDYAAAVHITQESSGAALP